MRMPKIDPMRAEALRARRSLILQYWGLDDRGFGPVMELRELQGDEWQAEAELDAIDFVLSDAP
ncbi:hypothetical protein EDF24_0600 [Curtobacterium sp. PhB130]|uniref:hypothetical protein n=1 Tax=unclassified Curtobacterium TaxID=257496 RepID=UPI000F4B5916|nr:MULTISPECIES: hypothetical protein [unclassified Curtobacterium]ROP63577.1 hypothetical protein EDF55_2337 [Curtobacterium sp. ZW137]ROS77838.1 hypothetical protein EDF24_0600 [Curtobacterium sp. PhB130]TCK65947.1 hypothetical protein EDF27_0696 [Curtobacterium sp. PhB136]